RRCDGAGGKCVDIAGATGSSYLVTSADVGSTLRLLVTASNAQGSAQAESAQSAVVTGGPAQPFFVAAAQAGFNGPNFALPKPAGIQAGDLLVAWLATDTTHTIASVPTGWTQLGTTQNDGSDSSVSAFWHVSQAGD